MKKVIIAVFSAALIVLSVTFAIASPDNDWVWEQLTPAKKYEMAVEAQSRLSPWWRGKITIEAVNPDTDEVISKELVLKTFRDIRDADRIAWQHFCKMEEEVTPTGWTFEITPRNKELAGFNKLVIRANDYQITSIEYN